MFRSTLAAFILTLLAAAVWADQIVLKDGTTLEGTVIKQGDSYWVKLPDGTSRTVPGGDVVSVGPGGAIKPPTPGAHAPTGTTTPTTTAHTPTGPRPSFASTKAKAEACDQPLAALALWQQYIEQAGESATDAAASKVELDKWKQLADTNAERILGKWVGGEERKAILAKANKLVTEGMEALDKDQTLVAVKKFEEAQKVYPNSFRVNFMLGFIAMEGHKPDEAMTYFNQALKLRPNAPEALANVGVILCADKRQYDQGITMLYKAAQIEDQKAIAQDLVTAIARAPAQVTKASKLKAAVDASTLLASKYHINTLLPPEQQPWKVVVYSRATEDAEEGKLAGVAWSGTGFLLNAEGLILTNRHVADNAKTLMVRYADETRTAEVVAIDDVQDLALIRIRPRKDEKLPFVQLSKADSPADGAECVVMGFPLLDRMGANIKVTRGIVSSGKAQGEADVVVDAKVNPGNSGGPMADKFGNIMSIVSMKSRTSTFEDSYGLGISAGRIRTFLAKNKITLTPGEPAAAPLATEDIAAKVKPATVCILAVGAKPKE